MSFNILCLSNSLKGFESAQQNKFTISLSPNVVPMFIQPLNPISYGGDLSTPPPPAGSRVLHLDRGLWLSQLFFRVNKTHHISSELKYGYDNVL